MSKILLRPAAPADAPVIFQMLGALGREIGDGDLLEASLADVQRDGFGPAPCYQSLIAEAHGRPAGMALYYPIYSTYKGRPCLFVNDLYVAPWARGLGLARRLMARVSALAARRGCCRVELHARHDIPARGFYEKIGMAASAERVYTVQGPALAQLAEEGEES